MPIERELCPHCGQIHEKPFSERVLAIYEKIRGTSDEEERGALLMGLVTEFANDFDGTNEDVNDQLHDMVDDFVASRIEHQQITMRLGRAVLRGIHGYVKAEGARRRGAKKGVTKSN